MVKIVPEVKQAVVEGELPGNVALEIYWAVNRTARREKQVLMLAEINHRPDVERRPSVRKIGL